MYRINFKSGKHLDIGPKSFGLICMAISEKEITNFIVLHDLTDGKPLHIIVLAEVEFIGCIKD